MSNWIWLSMFGTCNISILLKYRILYFKLGQVVESNKSEIINDE